MPCNELFTGSAICFMLDGIIPCPPKYILGKIY
jgi:hypothetical protein